jgi:hypothetical protein
MELPDIQKYIDEAITLWRDVRDGKTPAPQGRIDLAEAYIDAYQSMRITVFGELLPTPEGEDPTRIADSPGPHVIREVDVDTIADDVARAFHESYERLAPEFGYKTREASAVPWEDVPDANASLMRAVARDLLERGVIAA